MRKKLTTEWEAWDVLAEGFTMGKRPTDGLCDAVNDLLNKQRIEPELHVKMMRRIGAYLRNATWAYTKREKVQDWDGREKYNLVCDVSPECQRARGMAALWMAMDAAWEASAHAIEDFRRATGRHGAVIHGNLETF